MSIIPFPSEEAIETYIHNTIIGKKPCPVDDCAYDYCLRQANLGAYGIADLIKINFERGGDYTNVIITIMEIKNVPLKSSHLSQLARYLTGLKRMIEPYANRLGFSFEITGQLVGTGREDDFIFLLNFLPDEISVYDVGVNLDDGFCSEELGKGWYKTSESKNCIKDWVFTFAREFRGAPELCLEPEI